MIQLAFMTPAPPVHHGLTPPLTWVESEGGWLLSGVWAEGGLEAAREQMGLGLRTLPVEAAVTNVFTGRTETASEAATRLEMAITLDSAFLLHGFDWQGLHFLHLCL